MPAWRKLLLYLYSANRLKYPLIRKRLIELWREALKQHSDPVLAWIDYERSQKCLSYKQVRGRGGFIRSNWQELNELIAAANVWTIKNLRPGSRCRFFSPIPAMSMVSYAAGTRYLSLLGGTCLSFYDWYCDLPPASAMTWASKPTYRNLPTGITPATSSPGVDRTADTYAGCPLLYRSTLQRH
ncbi:molybdopterin-dependent oxidoreductase [Escherichia coli]